jgi:hypothetical protein
MQNPVPLPRTKKQPENHLAARKVAIIMAMQMPKQKALKRKRTDLLNHAHSPGPAGAFLFMAHPLQR